MRKILGLLTAVGFLAVFTTVRAEPLAVGAQAPAITATTEAGSALDLGTVYPKGYTLVFFYPQAGSAEDIALATGLGAVAKDLAAKGVTVIGVSVDDVATLKTFKEQNQLPFTLISDPDHAVIKAFGVPISEQWGTGPRAMRQTFLIDKTGKVVWQDLKAGTKEQAAAVLKALKDLGA